MPLNYPTRPWMQRAMNYYMPNTEGHETVRTAVEYLYPDSDAIGVFPTIRLAEDGNLRRYDVDEARRIAVELGDFIPVAPQMVDGSFNPEKTFEFGNQISKDISRRVDTARQTFDKISQGR